MYFVIGLIIFMMMMFGINFCFVLIGGTPFHKGEEFAPVTKGKRTYTVQRFAVAVLTSTFGAVWLAAWVYFIVTGWDSFVPQFNSLLLHVVLQFVASITLIVAGIATFKQWKRSKGLFLSSMGILVGSVVIAISMYGPRGHGEPLFMYLLGAWTLIMGGFLTTAIYLLDRLLSNGAEPSPEVQSHSPAHV
jgi:hypothetical protein